MLPEEAHCIGLTGLRAHSKKHMDLVDCILMWMIPRQNPLAGDSVPLQSQAQYHLAEISVGSYAQFGVPNH